MLRRWPYSRPALAQVQTSHDIILILEVVQGVEGGNMKRRLLAAPYTTLKIDKRNIALGVVVCSE